MQWQVDTTKTYLFKNIYHICLIYLNLFIYLFSTFAFSYCREGVLTSCWSCRPILQVSKHRGPTYTDFKSFEFSNLFFIFFVSSVCLDKQLPICPQSTVYAWNLEAMSAETCDSSNDLTWVSCGFLHDECPHVYQQRTTKVFVETLFFACFPGWGTMPVFWIRRKNLVFEAREHRQLNRIIKEKFIRWLISLTVNALTGTFEKDMLHFLGFFMWVVLVGCFI